MFFNYGNTKGLVTLILYLVLVTGILLFQSRFAEKLRVKLTNKQEETLEAKERVEGILDKIKQSVKTLKDFVHFEII